MPSSLGPGPAEAPDIGAVRAALAALGDADVEDVLSPLQLEELALLLVAEDAGEACEDEGTLIGRAADLMGDEELSYLLSPLQMSLLHERHSSAQMSTMMCSDFFRSSRDGARDAPMLPTIVLRGGTGGASASTSSPVQPREGGGVVADRGNGSSRGSSPDSSSNEDTMTGGSRGSSFSWISDGGPRSSRGEALGASGVCSTSGTSGYAGGHGGRGHGAGGHGGGGRGGRRSGGPAPPPAVRYASYKHVPSSDEMAAAAAARMGAWQVPNGSTPGAPQCRIGVLDHIQEEVGTGATCLLYLRARAAQERAAAARSMPTHSGYGSRPGAGGKGRGRSPASRTAARPSGSAGAVGAERAMQQMMSWGERARRAREQGNIARAVAEHLDGERELRRPDTLASRYLSDSSSSATARLGSRTF